MRTIAILTLAAAAASGCIVEHQAVVRDEPPVAALPPPPPQAEPAPPQDQPAPPPAYSEDDASAPPVERDVDVETFYDRLSPYGYWTFVGGYGRVWVPNVAYGWRPYYYGRWVLTDWGWTFVSDDPWGWAAYHYGRWNFAVGVGWYWIPGRIWGPAWVHWRYGGRYVTWCPMGPSGVVFGYNHPAWVAVRETHFTRPIATVAAPPRVTAPIVTSAAPLAGPHATVARNGQFGPPVARIAQSTGVSQIRPVHVRGLIGYPADRGAYRQQAQAGMASPTVRPRTLQPQAAPAAPTVRPQPGYERQARPRYEGQQPAQPAPRAGGNVAPGAPRVKSGAGNAPVVRPRGGGGGRVAPAHPSGGGGSAPKAHPGGGKKEK